MRHENSRTLGKRSNSTGRSSNPIYFVFGYVFEGVMDRVWDVALTLQIQDGDLSEKGASEWAIRNLEVPIPADLTWPNFITHRRNQFGIPESVLRCPVCHMVYSVTPAIEPGGSYDPTCLSPDCESYDINRDVMAILTLDNGKLERRERNEQ